MRFLLLVILPVAAVAEWRSAYGEPKPPNVVMVISDDQTYTDFGFMGDEVVHTPNLDALAKRSTVFTHGFVPTSVCRPSLVTLLTGLYPHQHGVHFNHPPPGFSKLTKSKDIRRDDFDALRNQATRLIRQSPSLPRKLADNGYRCLQTGKFWEGHYRNAGFTDGMSTARPSGGLYGDITLASGDVVAHGNGDAGLDIGRRTMKPIIDFLDDVSESPFFIWYAPFLPHVPHDAPEEFTKLYESSNVEPFKRPYYASISQFDATVGTLIDEIESRGRIENTLFVFVVDNGWSPDATKTLRKRTHDGRTQWDHTLESKRAPFDDGLRTPILIAYPGVTRPIQIDHPVSSVDIVPTILAAASIADEADALPGQSLLPFCTGESELAPDQYVFGEIYPGDATRLGDPSRDIAYRWVRQMNFKLIVPHRHHGEQPWGGFLSGPALFDLRNDPREQTNLIDDKEFAVIAERLGEKLDQWWIPTIP